MPMRFTLFGILGLALSQPLAADPLRTDCCVNEDVRAERAYPAQACGPATQQLPQALNILPRDLPRDLPGDIFGGRGPYQHARELRALALYASIGNRDAVEILSRRLRKFGVTRVEIQDAIDGAKLHPSSPCEPVFEQY